MGFVFLASEVRFDTTNEEGHILHTATGACVDLDPMATRFLETALSAETKVQSLEALSVRIDAALAQLEEALEATLDPLCQRPLNLAPE